jgi:hypothetical protein
VAKSFEEDPRKFFYIHLSVVVILDFLVFFIWQISDQGMGYIKTFLTVYVVYPWFYFPVFLLGIPLIFHWYCLQYSTEDPQARIGKMHILVYADINTLLFIMWLLSGDWPWFIFVHVVWGPLLLTHLFCVRRYTSKSSLLPTSTYRQPEVLPPPSEGHYAHYMPQPHYTVYAIASQIQLPSQPPMAAIMTHC